jgi:hypothetical protein
VPPEENVEWPENLGRSSPAAKAGDSYAPRSAAIRRQRGLLNDIHKKILSVTKGLEKRPS